MTSRGRDHEQRDKDGRRRLPAEEPEQTRTGVAQHLSEPLGLRHAMAQPGQTSPTSIFSLQRAAGNWAVSHRIQAKLMVGAADDHYEREADRIAAQVLSMPGPAAHAGPGSRTQPIQRLAEEEEEVQTKPLAASIIPLVQRQWDEEEVQTRRLVQRAPVDEDEIQTKPLVQRKGEDREDVQRAPIEEEEIQTRRLVQRAPIDEEEVQTKRLVQRKGEDREDVQRAPIEEEEVQTKRLVQRAPIEEEEVQTRRASRDLSGRFEAGANVESRLAASRGNGNALPAEVRAYMEPRFGADLSGVRLHADSDSTALNQELGARAFTHGKDIYLRTGDGDPTSPSGKELLAHELTHTLQQGAVRRIQRWFPTGHRLVTQAAFKEGGFGNVYSKEAQDYLVDRSPDIDFIQDQILSMNEGIGLGKSNIENYEALIKAGQDERAREMWQKNDLHYRDPSYMLSHGEGGLYKQDKAAASAINAAMTSKMVMKAFSLWKWDDPATYGPSLSLLSDALHQAEDRGSHGEGTKFRGHDSRLNVKAWAKEHKRPLKSWERWEGAPPEAAQGTWMPDNFSINKVGGVLGVGFAQGALRSFASLLRRGDKKGATIPGPGGSATEKRAMRARSWMWFQSKSSGLGAAFIGKSGEGRTTAGKASSLAKILSSKEELKLTGELGENEYEQATKAPSYAHLPVAEQQRLQKGMDYYITGAGLDEVSTDAMAKFRELAKSRFSKGGKKKSERILEAKAYYLLKTAPHRNDPQAWARISDTILKAYEQVFHVKLYENPPTP